MDELKQNIPTIERNSVVSAIRLHKIRGLLSSTIYPTSEPFGRPIIKFRTKADEDKP